MKILKIEKKKDCTSVLKMEGGKVLYPVTVTARTWYGKTKTFDAFPTNYGPTYWGHSIIYFYFCDENGNQLENISKQINNWIANRALMGYCGRIRLQMP